MDGVGSVLLQVDQLQLVRTRDLVELGHDLVFVQAHIARVLPYERHVEDAAWKLIEILALDCREQAHAYAGPRREILERKTLRFAFRF